GATSVGVVTPFRAQADAIEAAVLAAFDADDLVAMDARVGTVHAFQGNERDVVIASLGLGPDDGPSSWRFVDDPHLFAVFVTRARRRMTFVVSCAAANGGLVGDYLAQADSPPGRPAPATAAPVGAWAQGIADDLGRAGLVAATGYPTGRHVVDLALGAESRSYAVECDVHPDGPEAHVDRHLALRRSGWQVLEAHRSKWADRPGELVVELIRAMGRT
ncbi:MAG TPA: AAA domain-containing protein, partial [Acidimicrobiales bacterium]|nr:AAA domain-containing protein [Acidimicrobiales bacterium]